MLLKGDGGRKMSDFRLRVVWNSIRVELDFANG